MSLDEHTKLGGTQAKEFESLNSRTKSLAGERHGGMWTHEEFNFIISKYSYMHDLPGAHSRP